MKIDRFLQLFVVKEKKFYPLYIEQAVNIEAAAKLLVELLQERKPENQKTLYKKVKDYEHSGDQITARLYEELNKTFVTPFDREDINRLGSSMDTLLDFIHDAAKRVLMYRPKNVNQLMVAMAQCIVEDARILGQIMDELDQLQKRPQEINEKCVRIKQIEHDVDNLYEEFMSDVFANEKDAIELVKLKNIGQVLEDATDRAKDVSDIVRGIIIKFA
ncbi:MULTISPECIES: DUF47 domain-containing protein [Butyricimonas]|uniref:DUF47 domain-containing protein n=1 Tax=Butyricimonas TaxID=574697 RepID=UPI000C08CDB4|nr:MULTISPECIES: DUF47 family protein [Butyricimonas]MCB6971559.1 DUF47 family protein [Butyricimonas synergistica]MCG4518273.1 DUF47 family protein [Butyricimonas sp. DFI.6.44]